MRTFRIRTGTGGMEMIEELFENSVGFGRQYIWKNKLPRILKHKKFQKSRLTGRMYKRFRLSSGGIGKHAF